MNPVTDFPRIFCSAATAVTLVIATTSALAAEPVDEMEEIVVQAPISLERKTEHSVSDPTSRTEVIELSRKVYIGDLDLSRYEDVKELESRIEQIAKDSCKKLDDMFPPRSARSRDAKRCIALAIKSAAAEKEAAIAEAR